MYAEASLVLLQTGHFTGSFLVLYDEAQKAIVPLPFPIPLLRLTDLCHNLCLSLHIALEELWSIVLPSETILTLNHALSLLLLLSSFRAGEPKIAHST